MSIIYILVLYLALCDWTNGCTPSRVNFLQSFCDVPAWFMPYGYDEGDTIVSENNYRDILLEAPPNVKFTFNGTSYSGQTNVSFNDVASIFVSNADTAEILEICIFDDKYDGTPKRWDIDGVVGVMFVRDSTDPDLMHRVSNIINHGMGISGQLFPLFVADWLAVITYHCVRTLFDSRPSTFQVVIAFGQNEIYILYSFFELHFPLSVRYECIVTGAGEFPLSGSPRISLVDDDYYRYDPRHYISMTNADRPGRWLQLIGREGMTVTPPTQNMWSPYSCRCGGCGTRTRVINGRREMEYGACPYFEAFPCPIDGVAVHYEMIRTRGHRRVTRNRRCCYDFRREIPTLNGGPERRRRRRSVNAKSKPRLAQFAFGEFQMSPYEELERPKLCNKYGGYQFDIGEGPTPKSAKYYNNCD